MPEIWLVGTVSGSEPTLVDAEFRPTFRSLMDHGVHASRGDVDRQWDLRR